MARMPSGAPRSVPDPHGDDYEEMLRQWRLNKRGDPDFVLPINPLTGQGQDGDDDLSADADPSFSLPDSDDEAASNPGMGSSPDQQAWPSNGALSLLPRSPGAFDFDGALLPANAGSSDLDDDGSSNPEIQLDPSLADCAPGTVGFPQGRRQRNSDVLRAANDSAAAALASLGKSWAKFQHGDPIGHPGLAESFVPVWGSGREALADLQEGDYLGAGVNAGLALLDVVPGEAIVDSGLKGAWKFGGSHTWNATRKMMGEANKWTGMKYFEKGEHGHHAFIPQNGWGKNVADEIKNQPWNIKVLKPEVHGRIHGRYRGMPQFNVLQRWIHGTPKWSKAAMGGLFGKSVMDAREANGEDQ